MKYRLGLEVIGDDGLHLQPTGRLAEGLADLAKEGEIVFWDSARPKRHPYESIEDTQLTLVGKPKGTIISIEVEGDGEIEKGLDNLVDYCYETEFNVVERKKLED